MIYSSVHDNGALDIKTYILYKKNSLHAFLINNYNDLGVLSEGYYEIT